ncbi:MAG TPA: serine/threonine protein kinase [Cyanobacteria bacterium UBA12227]|nr:serine/threonine protein kinase [Cyanobacteria bacterium UBA12227]HAX86110.1 serine/threonine protein kinase [Cyanobacteria bacterium UBA11370]HBY81122.1 serine/threonine protein kinase [Cyanobacteria bacterium UBA11148]
MTWTVGQKLHNGKYVIEKELGRRRFGITYLATDEQGNKLIIETLNEDQINSLTPSDRDSLKCKFVDEARKLECCKHRHIVGVDKTFIEGQLFCLALEYIRGDTLASLTQKALSEQEALDYIQQVGKGLIELHTQGLLHQNIKPENIIVRGDRYEAVLIDFNLAADFEHLLSFHSLNEPFAPLELNCEKMPRGACTDVYSLAATLYRLLTGQYPTNALDRQQGKADLIPPKVINPRLSRRVNDAIMKGMRLEPDTRPQTMQEWLDLLGLKPSTSISWFKANAGTVWTVFGTLAGLLVTLVALGVYVKLSLPPSQQETPSDTPTSQVEPIEPNKP